MKCISKYSKLIRNKSKKKIYKSFKFWADCGVSNNYCIGLITVLCVLFNNSDVSYRI